MAVAVATAVAVAAAGAMPAIAVLIGAYADTLEFFRQQVLAAVLH